MTNKISKTPLIGACPVRIAKPKTTEIPADSLTRQYLPAEYTDAFACEVTGARKLTSDELHIDFWTVMPGWVNAMFKLRNILVRPFGLKTGKEDERIEEFINVILNGGSIEQTSMAAKSDNETVLLLSDTHLDAYMSFMIVQQNDRQIVTAITLVHYHNSIGKVYFFFVKPFHKIIVKSMLRSTLKRVLGKY